MREAFFKISHESAIFIATFFVCWAMISFTLIKKRTDRIQNRLFIGMCVFTLIGTLCNIIYNYAILIPDHGIAYQLRNSMSFIYFSTHTLLIFLFFEYSMHVGGQVNRMKNKSRGRASTYLLVIVAELIALSNPLTHWVYTLDEKLEKRRMPGEYVIYAIAAVYITASIIILMINWHVLSRQKRNSLTYFLGIMLTGVVVQLLVPEIKSELFAESLALIGVMIIMENEDDRIDLTTGVYNRNALIQDLTAYSALGTPLSAIAVHVTNAEMLQRLFGSADTDSLIVKVGDYLKFICKRVYIYRATTSCFVIVRPDDETEDISEKIIERFNKPFIHYDAELMLQDIVMCADIPDQLSSALDIILMADSPLPKGEYHNPLRGDELKYLIRRSEVEKALHRGISEKSFEVYYQPIYRREGMSIYSAEALLRLRDSRIGDILPDEFIPLAEQNGMIDRLGDYVLEEVCMFLASGIPMDMGLENISVNLSVMQCMHPDFVSRILAITSKYNVSPSRINLEITESAASSDYAVLERVLGNLKDHGFLFSMDDYGTGYSNVQSVFSLDYDLVKIDRSILWEACRGSNGRIILENYIRMIREMDLRILVEGVETQEQIDMLEDMNVDFLQGFYFSRPVSKNELLGILRVTDLARIEEQRAKAVSEAKSTFIENMSHEIRTPINALLGMDEMILRESRNPRILDYARKIEGAGRTLLSLISDILDLSKIESGSMEINENEYEMQTIISDVVNMIHIRAEQKKLAFNVNIDPGLPSRLFGDEMRIRQIMVNILGNAVKYTREGSVTLDISHKYTDRDHCLLLIDVSDTGIGIKEEDLGRLFIKFARLDESRNKNIEGTGLGLAITYNLLKLMNGEISARSVYGKGSVFSVTLPQTVISREGVGNIGKDAGKDYSDGRYRVSFRAVNARILAVDDTMINLTVIKQLLKQTGIMIDTAMSGHECLDKTRMNRYDLILLDYRMPEMDGIETLKQMKNDADNLNIHTPVVALTANAVSGARENFLRAGFDDYMTKPVNTTKLENMLISFLPSEKVNRNIPADSRSSVEKSSRSSPDWKEALKFLDIDAGTENCGSDEGYYNVLRVYYEGYAHKSADIEKALEKKDWENYTIQVHSLKSSSALIGATELAGLSELLEEAGNCKDTEKIYARTKELLGMYFALADKLGEVFSPKEAEDEPKAPISGKMVREAYETIKDFAKLYDYDNIMYVLDSLKKYELGEEAARINEIRECADLLEWEAIIRLVERYKGDKDGG